MVFLHSQSIMHNVTANSYILKRGNVFSYRDELRSSEEKADISFQFHWEIVCSEPGRPYCFPEQISISMKQNYKKPSVYRWNIIKEGRETPEAFYIGEAQILCLNRLNNYIRPGPSQQTSRRIHSLLESYCREKYITRIERLEFSEIRLNDLVLRQDHLSSKSVRRFLEELLVTYYMALGVKVLNL